ncbi:MAG: class I fructose-bisphosphate aldolase [bacterium]|nr:class I fructose-bisphosphate aldolase [bacterium]
MNTLQNTAKTLLASGKGILAADESPSTNKKRFDKYGIPDTEDMRRKWRELLFTTPDIEKYLSGIILYEETLGQETDSGMLFPEFLAGRGIIPGIKVDQKTEAFGKDEEVTKGLDGLAERLSEYAHMGAQFTKWRAVIRIGEGTPSAECVAENARRMAEYARLSQQAGLVPIVEPEVLLDGNHSFARCEEVVANTLKVTFDAVHKAGVALDSLLLKTSMVLPGKESGEKRSPQEVAEATVRVLMAGVPKEVAGIVFLSGGQTPQEATERLNEIVKTAQAKSAPWPLTFSYSRALQDPVMAAWQGIEENTAKAQEVFKRRISETAAASRGEFSAE